MKFRIIILIILITAGKLFHFQDNNPVSSKKESPTKKKSLNVKSAIVFKTATKTASTAPIEIKTEDQIKHNSTVDQNNELKNFILGLPSDASWRLGHRDEAQYKNIIHNEKLVSHIFQIFGNLDLLINEFGDQQALARVKMIRFFKNTDHEYDSEIISTLKSISQENGFFENYKSRQADYIDLASIYFEKFSEDELKDNLNTILSEIKYEPNLQPVIATAIRYAHPSLLNDTKFVQMALPLLKGDTL